MLDTMTFTKVVGAFCGALLVFMLVSWAADELYRVETGDGRQAFVIETGAEEVAAPAEAEVDFAALLAAADVAAGERLYRACAACHALEDGRNGVGPHLWAIVGRDKAAVEGFRFSEAMLAAEGAWTPESLEAFIENPRAYVPGTSMAYAGMRRPEDRANLIAYLATYGN
jgi:cytochrome c